MVFEKVSLLGAYHLIKERGCRVDDFMDSLMDGHIKLRFNTTPKVIPDDEEYEVWGNEDYSMSYEKLVSIFEPRELTLPTESFEKAWIAMRDRFFSYFELSTKDELRSRTLFSITVDSPELKQFDNTNIWIGDIYLDKEKIIASKLTINLLLKSMIQPLDDSFRKVRIIWLGQEYVDEFNDAQAKLLKRLYLGTIENPNFSIDYDDFGDDYKNHRNKNYQEIFCNRKISELHLLKNVKKSIRFNLSQD